VSNKESNIIENANYLANIVELDFTKCIKYAEKYPDFTKEELLSLYFENPSFA